MEVEEEEAEALVSGTNMPLLGETPLCRRAQRSSLDPCPQTCSDPLWPTRGITDASPHSHSDLADIENINSKAAFHLLFLLLLCHVDSLQGFFLVLISFLCGFIDS